jgi:hypothetical protein
MSKWQRAAIAVALVCVLGALIQVWRGGLGVSLAGRSNRVDALIDRNVAARGGAAAWRAVSSLRLNGQMAVGQGMHVPYVLEQKRPGKMCLEFVFDDDTTVQCIDGETGWKRVPFRGRTSPEPMTPEEWRELAVSSEPAGLLFDSAARGNVVELIGQEPVEGRDAFKLEVTLPGGAVRWVYLDAETGLEVKLEALRRLAGREVRVETFYSEWQETEGVLIPRRQETRTEGLNDGYFLTVEGVDVNPPLDDARFRIPSAARGGPESGAADGMAGDVGSRAKLPEAAHLVRGAVEGRS